MSVFHRIESIEEISSARWFRLAERVAAYDGILRAVLLKEQQDREEAEDNASRADTIAAKMRASASQYKGGQPQQQVEATPITSILTDPDALAKVRAMATITRGGDQ